MNAARMNKCRQLAVTWKSSRWSAPIEHRRAQNGATHNGDSHLPRFEFRARKRGQRSGDAGLVVKWGRIQARQ